MSRKDDINELITEYQRRLHKREVQKAKLGVNTSPEILIEIEDIKAEIENLQEELEILEDSGNPNILIRRESLVPEFTDEKLNFLTNLDAIRGILSSFDRIDLLGEKALTKLCIVEVKRREKNYGDSSRGHGLALKEILNQAIETLKPRGPSPQWAESFINDLMILNRPLSSSIEGTDEAWQEYLILKLTASGIPRKTTADLLSISVRNAHNRLNSAANKVGNILYQWEQDCKNISSLPKKGEIYVERKANRDLKQWITNWNRNENLAINIQGLRGTGKTSLLQRSGIGYAGQLDIQVAAIDLNEFGKYSLTLSYDDFLRDLVRLIVRKIEIKLNMEEIWEEQLTGVLPNLKLTEMMEEYILPEVKGPIILALDAADLLLVHSRYYRDFFSMLRSWCNKGSFDDRWKKFGLILVISTEPFLLIDDPNISPFNIGHKIQLEDFDKEDLIELIRQYNQRYGSEPATEKEIDSIMALLGGHPALVREVFDALVNDKQETWNNIAHLAAHDVYNSLFSTHLIEVFGPLREQSELKEVFQQVIKRGDSPDDVPLIRLDRAGLIKRQGNSYECRNKLYKSYFENSFHI